MAHMDNIARVREANLLFRDGDMDGGMQLFAEDVVYVQPGRSVLSGVKHGRDAVRAHIEQVKAAGLSNTPQRWFVLDDQVLTLTTIRVHGHEFTAVDILTFRDGQVVRFESVTDTSVMERVYGIRPDAEPRLEHIGMNVRDVEASAAWYREVLGAREVGREVTASGLRIVTVEFAGVLLDLGSRDGIRPHPRAGAGPAAATTLTGFSHIGLVVEDCAATVAELRGRGVEFVSEPALNSDGTVTFAWFVDPDGNHLELLSRRAATG